MILSTVLQEDTLPQELQQYIYFIIFNLFIVNELNKLVNINYKTSHNALSIMTILIFIL